MLKVTDGSVEFEVRADLLTNDLDIAAQVGQRDETAQQALRAAATNPPPIAVIKATYGYGSQVVDVTRRVRNELQNGKTWIHSGNHLANYDPAFGKVKTLTIWYSLEGGRDQVAYIKEGDIVDLAPRPSNLPTPTPEIRYVPAPTPRENPLERGAYDRKSGVAKPIWWWW